MRITSFRLSGDCGASSNSQESYLAAMPMKPRNVFHVHLFTKRHLSNRWNSQAFLISHLRETLTAKSTTKATFQARKIIKSRRDFQRRDSKIRFFSVYSRFDVSVRIRSSREHSFCIESRARFRRFSFFFSSSRISKFNVNRPVNRQTKLS